MSLLIAVFFGTRPQVIKASVLRQALATVGPVALVDTGQHYDYALHRVHYDQLGVAPPDAYLGVGSGSHAAQTGAILSACEQWIAEHKPGVAVVIGDTNSTLACALAAAKARVPVVHVEAGLRAMDRMMAEDVNRRAVDAIADLLCAPCERVAVPLRRQFPDAQVDVTGDVAYDVLQGALPRCPPLEAVAGYDRAWGCAFVYATLHRAELVDEPDRLATVVRALGRSQLPCLLAAHPRTAATLESLGYRTGEGSVHLTEPVGYLESLSLARQAAAIVTDSGGLQREAYWLGTPCITLRDETEWLETVQYGANVVVAPKHADALADAISSAVERRGAGATWKRDAYGDGHAAAHVAAAVQRRFMARAAAPGTVG